MVGQPGRLTEETCVSITRSPDSTRSGPGVRLAGFAVRLTLGAQLLAMLTVLAGALVLPDVAPGLPAVAYLAATAVLVIGFLASLIAHELAHAVVARRHGATAEEIRIGFFGGTAHGRHEYATPRGLWRAAAAGPAFSLILGAAGAGVALGLSVLEAGRRAADSGAGVGTVREPGPRRHHRRPGRPGRRGRAARRRRDRARVRLPR